MTYRAHIERAVHTDTVRLHVWRPVGGTAGIVEALLEDGSWMVVDAVATTPPTDAGISLPVDTLEAVAAALAEYLGHHLPSAGEIAVLREWLTVERGRVDRTLEGGRP